MTQRPIVYEGMLYIVTGADDAFAISIDSGEILWSYEADLDPDISTICCGWTSRGVGLGEGKVFVGQLDGKLVALDRHNGDVVWSVQAERWQEGLTITSAPLYYDGLVITGFAGAEYGVRGRVKAYDADDGSLVWTCYTVPGPGEIGHDTWPADNEVWKHGGATVYAQVCELCHGPDGQGGHAAESIECRCFKFSLTRSTSLTSLTPIFSRNFRALSRSRWFSAE